MRFLFFALLLAVSITPVAPFAGAQGTTAHHKTPVPNSAHRAKRTPKSQAQRRTPTRVRPSVRHSIHPIPAPYLVHRRSVHHGAHIVRARMTIRHYAWMDTKATPHRTPVEAAPETAAANEDAEAQPADAEDSEGSAASSTHVGMASAMDGSPSAASQPIASEAPVADAASKSGTTMATITKPAAQAEIAVASPPSGVLPPELRSRNIVAMAPLRGSLESLMRQNDKTNADNLERIENDSDLHERITTGVLVPVPASDGLTVNPDLPQDRRYCRPWTATFLKDFSRAHLAQFHRSFEVSSAVRTVEYQKRLMRTNGNAAPAEGDVASPHLTGATIDIAKHGMTRSELYWMRNRLSALQEEGKIDVEEEFHQSCFHITVYKSYVGAGPLHPHHVAPVAPADGADDSPAPVGVPTTGV